MDCTDQNYKVQKKKKNLFNRSRNLEGKRRVKSIFFCCWRRMVTGLFVPLKDSNYSYPSVDQ